MYVQCRVSIQCNYSVQSDIYGIKFKLKLGIQFAVRSASWSQKWNFSDSERPAGLSGWNSKFSRTVPKKLTWPFLSCNISASCKILQVFAQMTGPNYESSRRKSNFSVLGQKSSTWQNYLKLQQDNNCNSRCPGLNRICSFVPVHTNMITLRIQWPWV